MVLWLYGFKVAWLLWFYGLWFYVVCVWFYGLWFYGFMVSCFVVYGLMVLWFIVYGVMALWFYGFMVVGFMAL